jgi:adenylosuccinate lyase
MADKLDQVGGLSGEEQAKLRHALKCVSPDDGKYASAKLESILSEEAEWRACAMVQQVLIHVRNEFGLASDAQVAEVDAAIGKIDPLNIALLEKKVTKHDQLAVLEELGRYISPHTKATLHPGTTSYDILDTARSYLIKKAWLDVVRPTIKDSVTKLCDLSERSGSLLQVGRTHLQDTSPVPFALTLSGYALRLAQRLHLTDQYANELRGKISGIVGTGASVDMVVGRPDEFERIALERLGLKPDTTATQIVQKEALADFGHGLVTLMYVLGDFSNDMRMLYSSAIGEVTARDNAARLGGSSADATKNNPIDWENICGKVAVVESGMRVLYAMIQSDFQRDLRNSVMARYQPRQMLAETYESFARFNRVLPQLSVNEDRMAANLAGVRKNPSEAMVAILRGRSDWVHPEYGVGHDFVKEMGKVAKRQRRSLLEVSLEDPHFKALFTTLPENKISILEGKLELYTGHSYERAKNNIAEARMLI